MAQLSSDYPSEAQEGVTPDSFSRRPGETHARRDLLDTVARPLSIVLLLGALVAMVAAAFWTSNETATRNDRLSEELAPLNVVVTDLQNNFQGTIADLRALALTDSPEYLDRYEASSAQLEADLIELKVRAAEAGYDSDAQVLVESIEDWIPFADAIATASAAGDRGPAGRLATLESQPRIDAINIEIAGIRDSVRAESADLRAERADLARIELAVIIAATVLGAVAGLLLLWLAAAASSRLRESRLAQARLASMVNSITRYGVYEVDRRGNLQYMSESAMTILGLDPDEVSSLGNGAISHRRQDGTEVPAAESPEYLASRSGEKYRGEDAFLRRDGTLMPADVTVEPVTVNGELQGAVVVFEDITKTIEIERFRQQFLAYASHELRTPITVISGFSGILRRRIAAHPDIFDKESREAIEHMDVAADRIRGIAETVLDLTRLMSGYPLQTTLAEVDVTKLVSEEIATVRAEHPSVKIVFSAPGRVMIHTAPQRLRQVISNLLSNAVKYGDGEITVGVACGEDDVTVRVRDNGPGIPEDERQLVFQQFYRSPAAALEPGTGVGLFISRQIAWALKGSLTVTSEEGHGAEFTLELPLAGATAIGAIEGPPPRATVRI